jgi:integrase
MSGVNRVTKRLADGSVKVYEYARKPKAKRASPRPPKPASGDIVADLIRSYQASPQYRALAPNSQRLYDRALMVVDRAIGLSPVQAITVREIEEIRDELQDTPTLANTVLTVTRVLWRRAIRHRMADVNPGDGIASLPVGTRERWTDDQIRHALKHGAPWFRRAVMLALATAQRAGDLIRIRWDDYDGDVIRVVQQKTGTALAIPIGKIMRAELSEWREFSRSGYVLETPRGLPWKANVFYTKCSLEIGRHLPLVGMQLHGLRHTAAARLAEAGATASEIQSITGHKSLTHVARYTRGVDQAATARAAVAKLERRKK